MIITNITIGRGGGGGRSRKTGGVGGGEEVEEERGEEEKEEEEIGLKQTTKQVLPKTRARTTNFLGNHKLFFVEEP